MRFFLSGVIQGSIVGNRINSQAYRDELKILLRESFPHPENVLVCPIELYPDALNFDKEQAKKAFEHLVKEASEADAIIAFLPTASNGTAIEIWEAARRGTPVFTISPMTENWVIKLYSRQVFPTMEAFAEFVRSGELMAYMEKHLKNPPAGELEIMDQRPHIQLQ